MIFRFKVFLKALFRRLGWNVSKVTSPTLIQEFLERTFPIATNTELIRIGGDADGGYLVPDDLDGIEACFSPGVADTATFELGMASRGIISYMADYSVESPPVQSVLFRFEKKFLGNRNNDRFMTLDDWVQRNAGNVQGDLLLQMDIEGAEYEVLLDCSSDTLNRFRIIVVEFHDLISLSDRFGYRIIDATFRKLLKSHAVVHIHPNNVSVPIRSSGCLIPPILEFTLLRKDRISSFAFSREFPHALDRPCMPVRVDVKLPECWYYNK